MGKFNMEDGVSKLIVSEFDSMEEIGIMIDVGKNEISCFFIKKEEVVNLIEHLTDQIKSLNH